MNKKLIIAILIVNVFIALFFSLYRRNEIPQCLNSDEVAFAYNAFSILQTGKDEYGNVMPSRLKSFGEVKLPLYSYLSIPIIAAFGYNDYSSRALNIFVMLLYIPLVYLIVKQLWKDERVALLSSFLVAVAPGFYILTRHSHEGPLCTLFILLALYYLLRYIKQKTVKLFALLNLFLVLATFSYHYGRIFLVFFAAYQIYLFTKSKKLLSKENLLKSAVIAVSILIPFMADLRYGASRVNNLIFYKTDGYEMRIVEYLNEDGNRILHNKAVESVRDVGNRYLSQISPEFFVINGDENWRFGMEYMGPVTLAEYLFFFVGLYFLFRNKEKFRYLVIMLFLVSPVANSLTWQGPSLLRTYFILFPLIFVAAYGFINFLESFRQKRVRMIIFAGVLMVYGYYAINNWDLYLNHYAKRAINIRAWQCGYRELGQYVKENYDKYDRFYITDQSGQPYIYMLHYLHYDPAKYQKQANLSAPDEYGFGRVEKFDKFIFKFSSDIKQPKSVFVGSPDEMKDLGIDQGKIKKIKIGNEEIFWIYESK